MLQELAARTDAQGWAIASLVFFILAFAVASAVAWSTEAAETVRRSRLPLGDDAAAERGAPER